MDKLRGRVLECTVQQEVFGSTRQPFLPSDDVGNFHLNVVDNIGEVISRPAIALDEYKVVEMLLLETDAPVGRVSEGQSYDLVQKPIGIRTSLGELLLRLLL